MAKINFLYRGIKEHGKLSVRLIHGKEIDYRIGSPITSKKEYWLKKTTKNGSTIYKHRKLQDLINGSSSAEIKAHKDQLESIQKSLLDSFLNDFNNGVPITKDWLKSAINKVTRNLDAKKDINIASNVLVKLKQEGQERLDSIKNANLLSTAIEKMFI